MMIFLATLAGVAMTPAPQTQIYTNELSKCLVEKSSAADQLTLVKWIFAVSTASPKVAGLSTVTAAERTEHNRAAGAIFTRLMSKDCRRETVAALRYEGQGAIETGFGTLGEVAMRNLMTDPAVAASVAEMGRFAATPDLAGVMKEAADPNSKP